MGINRRASILSVCAGLAFAQTTRTALSGEWAVGAILDYLNAMTTLRTRFSQIAPNGHVSRGVLQIWRPGRLKMDYDPPSKILLIAPGDWRLIFYDGSIRQVNTIPIGQTPLGVLLDDEIRFDGDIEIKGTEEFAGEAAVTLVRRHEPDQGSVTLVFQLEPMALSRWTVLDAQGFSTTVAFEGLELGVEFDDDEFHWRDPKIFGYPDD